jgi:hypothetical protein
LSLFISHTSGIDARMQTSDMQTRDEEMGVGPTGTYYCKERDAMRESSDVFETDDLGPLTHTRKAGRPDGLEIPSF